MKTKSKVSFFWRPIKARPIEFYVYLFGLIISLLILGALFYGRAFSNQVPKKGVLAEDQLFPATAKEAYRNLDLKIASQANFESGPIKKIDDLGIENGVDTSVISFQVMADHITEYALMTVPTTPKPKNGFPVIILCHGYAKPKAYSTYKLYVPDMEEYSRHGFIVIKPDFRGQGLSIHSGLAGGAYYSMGYNTDLMSLITAVKKTPRLNKDRISLWGHSMGAYIALRAAVLSSDIKNVILLSGPVGDVRDMFRSFTPISDQTNPIATDIKQAVLLRYGTPVGNPTFWLSTSPLSYLDKLQAQVQIHVGSLDTLVPPQFSSDLNLALNNAHKPHDYYIYPDGDHGLIEERGQIYARSLRLLQQNPASTTSLLRGEVEF